MNPFYIGPYEITTPVILAPMAGVTDRPFRQLCKNQGAGLAVTEMVGANSLLYGSEKTKRRANHEGETRPCSVQIVGSCPDKLAEAARINEANGAEIIDINMGCPAKKICNTMAGSHLLKDEQLVKNILEAVVDAVKVPVTLKIRTGWDACNRNGVTIAQIAQDAGIQALAVHGRTRACYFKGDAEYDTIAEIKSRIKIPVIANGDITTPEKAKFVLEKTGVDALMVGRAAQGRPWIFNEITHFLKTGEKLPEPDSETVRKIMLDHLMNLYAFYGEGKGVMIARKHVSWYSKGHRNGSHFRNTFNLLATAEEQLMTANAFFDSLQGQTELQDVIQ